jgi:DNA-binding transcriptional MerR regulator/effector-binding domain-containing protein
VSIPHLFSIGEFSKITGLPVKTLRFYHERGLLNPLHVDPGSGYRAYDQRNAETARAIVALREYGFGLDDISEILRDHSDEADIVSFLEQRKRSLHERIANDRELVSRIDQIIQRETEARIMSQQTVYPVEEKTLPSILIGGIRTKGRYQDCGKVFSRLGRSLGRYISGKFLCLYYDGEYRDEDADFEPCTPISKLVNIDGIDARELSGGRCVSVIHRGPYDELGRSYERALRYVKEHRYETLLPTREVYLKGPGIIFKGNPRKYLTEIQILIEEPKNAR